MNTKRRLIQKGEEQISVLQGIGFFLMLIGTLALMICSFIHNDNVASIISVAFFVTMLGYSFAFPSLLKGNDGLSNMRIVVFMVTNIVCMLLLKIGWAKDITSLSEIGLDQYWMGIIAFVFGAKATQSLFENWRAWSVPTKQSTTDDQANGTKTTEEKKSEISQIAIAQIAKVQNEGRLYSKYLNIQSVSDTLKAGKSCLTIYATDDNITGFPSTVYAQLNDNWTVEVPTEIIANSSAAITHIGQSTDELSDSNNPKGFGSICCMVSSTDNPSLKFIVTAGHNFTKGNFESMGGFIFNSDQRAVLINGAVGGKLIYQRMHFTQDLAIVLVPDTDELMNNYISFKSGHFELSIQDIKTKIKNVTIVSRINEKRVGSNIRDAFVLDHNIPFDIVYNGEKKRMQNVILIGDSNDPQKSKEVSMLGDSGSCVFHKSKDGNQLIGILVGGNGQFSFVLPLKEILESNNLKLI